MSTRGPQYVEAAQLRPTTTFSAAGRLVASWFAAAGIESASRDARLMLQALADIDGARLILRGEDEIGDLRCGLLAMAKRRLAREPISRIIGKRGFYGREFALSSATLDPRPETEIVVESALSLIHEEGLQSDPINILDIGTGSGCILISLLSQLPKARGVGTDISANALAMAERNAITHGVADRTQWPRARSGAVPGGPFDLIVSNPPYIASGDIAFLEPEVRNFDPIGALDGGDDGLQFYEEIITNIAGGLSSGWCAFEIGVGQSISVIALVKKIVGADVAIRQFADLDGRPRCVAWKARS